MASFALRELAKKSSLRALSSLNKSQHSNLLAPSLYLNQLVFNDLIQVDDPTKLKKPNLCSSPTTDEVGFSNPLLIYQNFPFGYCLNPISGTGLELFQEEDEQVSGSDEVGSGVWADSVKKKRKRKMNKHKYKKLRKRLRRKT